VGPVIGELVSVGKFPDNQENTANFAGIQALRQKRWGNSRRDSSGTYWRIPHAADQGKKSTETRNDSAQAGIFGIFTLLTGLVLQLDTRASAEVVHFGPSFLLGDTAF
jgi:hypothetical protein